MNLRAGRSHQFVPSMHFAVVHMGLEELGIRIPRFADGKMVEMWWNRYVLPVSIGLGLVPTFPAEPPSPPFPYSCPAREAIPIILLVG